MWWSGVSHQQYHDLSEPSLSGKWDHAKPQFTEQEGTLDVDGLVRKE